MAGSKRNSKPKKLRYFFLDGKIHKVLKSSRSKDEIVAWCYPDHKRMMYSYSQVKKYMGTAYTILDAARMLNRHRVTIQDYIIAGKVSIPAKIYPIGESKDSLWFKYMLTEKNILDLHEHILDSGYSETIPSRAEMRGLLKNNLILYTKTEEGKFVPVWKDTATERVYRFVEEKLIEKTREIEEELKSGK